MGDSRKINTPQSSDLVTYTVLIDGQELSRAYSIISITVEKEINRIPTAKIVLIDGDPATQDFELSNQDLFVPGRELAVRAGYHSDEESIFAGIVVKHSIKIRPNQSLLIVECKDRAVKLTVGRKSRYYYNSSDSEIIEEILSESGLDKDVEATKVEHQEMVQYNATDWDFLVTRAQVNGMVCVVDNGLVRVQKPDVDQDVVETVAYGATLLDLDAEIDARHQYSKITAYGWNAADQESIASEANDPSLKLNGNLSPSDLSSVIGLDNFELKNGGNNTLALQEWADAKGLLSQLAKVRGRIKFQGIAGVGPNTTLQLEGVGERFSGKIYISGVRHQIAEGNWTVDAQFGIDPKLFTEAVNINDLPAAGLLAAVNGLQVAIVTQLEGDPNGEDRVLVRMPIIDSEGEGIWARIATLDAGNNRGSFFRPEISDEVIVGFINENPNDAVILGMLNSSNKPAPIEATDDNHEKGFVTREGIRFIFNDEKKSATLETPDGKKVILDDDAGIIQLEDDNGNKIILNSDGITLDSSSDITIKAAGDITVEGANVSQKADMQMKSEGGAGVEVSSSATAVLKGAVVQIN